MSVAMAWAALSGSLPFWFVAIVLGALLVSVVAMRDEALMVAALFVTLAYPYRLRMGIGPLNSFSIAEVMLLVVWVALLAIRVSPGSLRQQPIQKAYRFKRLDVAIFLYIGINLASFVWARQLDYALRGIIPILENAAFYYLVLFYCSTRERIHHVAALFLLLGIVAMVLSVMYYFGRMTFLEITPATDEALARSLLIRLGSPAWGPSNYFASILLLFLPSYFCLAALARLPWKRLFYGVMAAGGLVIMGFTLSRGAYLALAGGLLAALFLFLKDKKASPRTVTALVIAAVVAALGFWAALTFFPEIDLVISNFYGRVVTLGDINAETRLALMQTAWDLVQKDWLGLGVGNFLVVGEFEGLGIHNIYLQTALEAGWLGGVLFIVMLAMLLRQTWKLIRILRGTDYEPLAYGLTISFVAVMINIGVEASFEGVIFGWLFWVTQGLVRALSRQT